MSTSIEKSKQIFISFQVLIVLGLPHLFKSVGEQARRALYCLPEIEEQSLYLWPADFLDLPLVYDRSSLEEVANSQLDKARLAGFIKEIKKQSDEAPEGTEKVQKISRGWGVAHRRSVAAAAANEEESEGEEEEEAVAEDSEEEVPPPPPPPPKKKKRKATA